MGSPRSYPRGRYRAPGAPIRILAMSVKRPQGTTAPGGIRALLGPLLLASLLVPAAPPTRGETTPLTLYQRCGRSPWVILGEVTDHDNRFAEIRVVEVLKGEYEGRSLRVIHRLENFLRESWEDRIEFNPGAPVILFLKRYDPEETDGQKVPEKLQAEDMFASSFGPMGVFDLPAEGQEAYLEAVRTFTRVATKEDPVAKEDALLGFLKSGNPHILQAGLEQVRDRRLAFDEHVPVLMELVDNDRQPIRLNALQVLGQVAEDLRVSRRTLPDQQSLVSRLKGKVLSDESDTYRSEALRVLVLLGGERERPFLERISKEDPSQLVRYQASRALLELGD